LFGRNVPLVLQSEAPECGIACVAMIAGYHGHRSDLAAMRMRLAPSMKGVTLQHIAAIAQTMKLSPRGVQAPLEALGKLRLPAILHWDMNHFVVLTKADGRRITVLDPARGKRVLPLAEASRHYTGVAMEFTPARARADHCLAAAVGRRRNGRHDRAGDAAVGRARGLRGGLAVLRATGHRPGHRRPRP